MFAFSLRAEYMSRNAIEIREQGADLGTRVLLQPDVIDLYANTGETWEGVPFQDYFVAE